MNKIKRVKVAACSLLFFSFSTYCMLPNVRRFMPNLGAWRQYIYGLGTSAPQPSPPTSRLLTPRPQTRSYSQSPLSQTSASDAPADSPRPQGWFSYLWNWFRPNPMIELPKAEEQEKIGEQSLIGRQIKETLKPLVPDYSSTESEVARVQVDPQDEPKKTSPGSALALADAIKRGSAEDITALIRAGLVDLNELYDDGQTIMHIAAKYGTSPQIIQILKDAGAQINVRDEKGKTPLRLATDNSKYETAQGLLFYRADPNIVDDANRAPLYYLQEEDKPTKKERQLIELLEPVTDRSLWFVITPEKKILRAVYANDLDTIREMLAKDQSLSQARYGYGYTLLHKKADDKYTFSEQVFRELVGGGVNVNAQDGWGYTPLHTAVVASNAPAVKILLELGADPNIRNNRRKTPLENELESLYQDEEIIKILSQKTKKEILDKLLGEKKEKSIDLAKTAIFDGKLNVVRQLLESGDLTQKDIDYLLYYASDMLNIKHELIELLFDFGANPNTRHGIFDESALHRTARYGRAKTARLLFERDADPNILNDDKKSPVYLAQEDDTPTSGQLEIIKMLEPVTHKNLQFVITPKIALKRAVMGGDTEKLRYIIFGQETIIDPTEEESKTERLKVPMLDHAMQGVRGRRPIYEILGVPKDVAKDELKRAFIAFVRTHHPDRYSNDETKRKIATEVMQYLTPRMR